MDMPHENRNKVLRVIEKEGPIPIDEIEKRCWAFSFNEISVYVKELMDEGKIEMTELFEYDVANE